MLQNQLSSEERALHTNANTAHVEEAQQSTGQIQLCSYLTVPLLWHHTPTMPPFIKKEVTHMTWSCTAVVSRLLLFTKEMLLNYCGLSHDKKKINRDKYANDFTADEMTSLRNGRTVKRHLVKIHRSSPTRALCYYETISFCWTQTKQCSNTWESLVGQNVLKSCRKSSDSGFSNMKCSFKSRAALPSASSSKKEYIKSMPGIMSPTRTVPALRPSLLQSRHIQYCLPN